MNLLLLEADAIAEGCICVEGPRARHLLEVWGVAPGGEVGIGVVDGPLGRARVEEVGAGAVALRVLSLGREPPPLPRVDVILALPRPKALARLYAPLASVGIGRLYLTAAERVPRYYFDAHAVTPEIWRPRLLDGLAQVRDTRLPVVSLHRSLRRLLDRGVGEATERLVADVAAGAPSPHAACAALPPDRRVLVAVGPEGGWTDAERDLLARHGFAPVSLGPRSLRTDVACIALLALVHDALRAQPV